ncbi:glutamate racemase [Secundilactobacillus oryzae JCM 18671]|uniref:Glutamate racemase n=1 Tax=Secundilactobacillus oryzae JCM 18671 TaxID=1291743 RepID=A0A081BJ08_9LACO|nr:glutamate racemase [Secundilactobacillus oryzae]GAK48026.1 glutamate racemase [Secundilactobacillus oryzae JCM 18671]
MAQAIGYMDSGVGGLTVVKETLKQLPYETVYFFGDQGRLPYGPRSATEVSQFAGQIGQYLLDKDIKMFVIACNTATYAALDDLRAMLPIPVIGVISPGARAATKVTRNHKIGLIATDGTIKSQAYEKSILAKDGRNEVFSVACQSFVTLVEDNEYTTEKAREIVKASLKDFDGTGIDTLILGCTHFPLLKPFIQEAVGPDVTLVDPAVETANMVTTMLDYFELTNATSKKELADQYFTSGDSKRFEAIANDWLPQNDIQAIHVPITDLETK